MRDWGKALLMADTGNNAATIQAKRLEVLFRDAPLDGDWVACVSPLGQRALLSLWNPRDATDRDCHRRELIVLEFDQGADVVDENLPELSEFLYRTLNPDGSSRSGQDRIGAVVSVFVDVAEAKMAPHQDDVALEEIGEAFQVFVAQKEVTTGWSAVEKLKRSKLTQKAAILKMIREWD